jgi:hypothetical protein
VMWCCRARITSACDCSWASIRWRRASASMAMGRVRCRAGGGCYPGLEGPGSAAQMRGQVRSTLMGSRCNGSPHHPRDHPLLRRNGFILRERPRHTQGSCGRYLGSGSARDASCDP